MRRYEMNARNLLHYNKFWTALAGTIAQFLVGAEVLDAGEAGAALQGLIGLLTAFGVLGIGNRPKSG
jgi:hypothetical protein